MNLSNDFKKQIITELSKVRQQFGGTDAAFAKRFDINKTVWSSLKNGKYDGQLRDTQWLSLGRELGISLNNRKWNAARTEVFQAIESDVKFCKENAKGMILVDDCAIGKTFTGKYLSKTMHNCFYLDCSQAKTKSLLVRALAKAIGIDHDGRISDIKENIKYYLKYLELPVIIVDEAGDLDYRAFLELKEFWNGTEGACGWYLMGADGLKKKVESGIKCKKVGYRELFSRYSNKFMKIVPTERQERRAFYSKLISDVLEVNTSDKKLLPELVKKCLNGHDTGDIGGLRRAETLLILHQKQAA